MTHFTKKQELALKELLINIASETNNIHAQTIIQHNLIEAFDTPTQSDVPKVAVIINGGLIDTVFADRSIELVSVDQDVQCAPIDEISVVLNKEAYVLNRHVDIHHSAIQHIFKVASQDEEGN